MKNQQIFWIDLPVYRPESPEWPDGDSWKNAAEFKSKKAALNFAQKSWRADSKGRVCLLAGSEPSNDPVEQHCQEIYDALLAMANAYDIGQLAGAKSAIAKTRRILNMIKKEQSMGGEK